MSARMVLPLALSLGLGLIPAAPGLGPLEAQEVRFACPAAEVSGTMLFPAAPGRHTCVVIVGGTLSHTRDGQLSRPGAPPRDALKRLAEELAAAGFASLRYDKVGHGQSKPLASWRGAYADEAQAAAAAIRFARAHPRVARVVVAGESAGAYVACLAAEQGASADAYLFLGALCGSSEEMYEYNFGRLAKYADSSPERRAWAEKHCRFDLALGRTYKFMLAAAARDPLPEKVELVDGGYRTTVEGLHRRREELLHPPDRMFESIQAPALALAGEHDLNVPPDHAARAAAIMRKAGNRNARSVVIPGADHSFQLAAADGEVRFRERYTLESFRRPYSPKLYQEIGIWLRGWEWGELWNVNEKLYALRKKDTVIPAAAPAVAPPTGKPRVEPRTEHTPERVQLAPGVEIIEDITDRKRTAAVETLEGRIGPLLLAEGCQAHFIDMPGGMFVAEHPHSTESIIYTVRGQWVLCANGQRRLMKPGSLFRFAPKVSTGYEVPFDESAFILIFKGDRLTKKEEEFITYLQGMARRLVEEQKQGVPYLLKDLPGDHPARKFAREVNPAFANKAP